VSANVHDNAFEMPTAAKAGDELRMPRWAPRIETGDRLEVAKPCATARELRQHGSSLIFSFGDGRGVAGVAPPGTRGVQVLDGAACTIWRSPAACSAACSRRRSGRPTIPPWNPRACGICGSPDRPP
jgi:hypothetical protein